MKAALAAFRTRLRRRGLITLAALRAALKHHSHALGALLGLGVFAACLRALGKGGAALLAAWSGFRRRAVAKLVTVLTNFKRLRLTVLMAEAVSLTVFEREINTTLAEVQTGGLARTVLVAFVATTPSRFFGGGPTTITHPTAIPRTSIEGFIECPLANFGARSDGNRLLSAQ